jgi:predicted esterase
MMIKNIETKVHGRLLLEERGQERLLVAFHGYAETAETSLGEVERIPGIDRWSVAAVQALHPFYAKQKVGASWMTSLDRELAIADNVNYIRTALGVLRLPQTLVFLGFSQGASMAARAAVLTGVDAGGLILLGGDVPPELGSIPTFPPTLIGRGARDDWYTDEKLKHDVSFLESRTVVKTCIFDGGHEWTDEFRAACGDFLASL